MHIQLLSGQGSWLYIPDSAWQKDCTLKYKQFCNNFYARMPGWASFNGSAITIQAHS